jgi:hypothetical protein
MDACSYQQTLRSAGEGARSTVAEDRLLHLESMVKRLMQNQESAQSNNREPSVQIESAQGRPSRPIVAADELQGEHEEHTRYVGSTHWSAILDDIHELKVVLGNSDDAGGEDILATLEAPSIDKELIFGLPKSYSLRQIISQYLPSKLDMDRLLSIYFQGEAYIVPFIHSHQFQRQYREFWKETTSVNPLWLSILFSVGYTASVIGASTSSYHSSQNNHSSGQSTLHTAAGRCLVLGEYHRPQQWAVQALALYGHCKTLRSLDPSREVGAILGMVVRMSYEMGYHRDPDSVGSFTAFEGEMRRRFWASCKQMDVMISFQLGLPSNICLEDCDTRSPRHLLDSDFDTDTQVLPAPRPENEATRLLWFIVKERQMTAFSKVCQDALSFREKSKEEIVLLDKEIREMYTTVPEVLRTRPLSESVADSSFLIMTRLYVEFIYLKSLCVLHRKYMTQGNNFSTRCCVEAGTKLVDQFIDVYKEFSPGGQLYTERWMLGNFTMHDFLLGVMVLCLVVHTYQERGSQKSGIDAAKESQVLALLEQSHAICVEKSTASKDVRNVSHAVRITLNGAKTHLPQNTDTQSSSIRIHPSNPQTRTDNASIFDPQYMSLPAWHSTLPEDQDLFGLMDPLSFMTNGIENTDWNMPDSQI